MRRWAVLHVGAARAGVFLPRGHGWNLGLILVSGRESRVTKFQNPDSSYIRHIFRTSSTRVKPSGPLEWSKAKYT